MTELESRVSGVVCLDESIGVGVESLSGLELSESDVGLSVDGDVLHELGGDGLGCKHFSYY